MRRDYVGKSLCNPGKGREWEWLPAKLYTRLERELPMSCSVALVTRSGCPFCP